MNHRRRSASAGLQSRGLGLVALGLLGLGLASLSWVAPTPALAGGFEFGDNGTRALSRGGAFVALSDDLTAMSHNPGGLIRSTGTRFLYNHNLSWASLRLTRTPSVIDPAGFDDLVNPSSESDGVFPLGITAVVGTDFGLDNWYFAIGVFGPSGIGSMSYDREGAQRYLMTDFETVLVYYTASIAYGVRESWGFGVSLQYVHAPSVKFGLVVDGQPNNITGVNPHTSPFDVAAELDLSDPFSFSAIVGGWWRPIPELEVGVSSRVMPIYLGLKGDVNMAPIGSAIESSVLNQSGTSAAMDLTLPPYVRAGLRYRYLTENRELFDVEINAVWEAWSTMKDYDVNLGGTAEVPNVFFTELPDLSIPRRWKDTFAVRLGGTYSPLDWLGISLGGYWESGAMPAGYEHVDFPSFMRIGVAGGLRFQFSGVDLNVAYMHVFQEDRNVDERDAKVFQVRAVTPCSSSPARCNGSETGAPANSGKYESSFDIVSVGLEFHFDEWFSDEPPSEDTE